MKVLTKTESPLTFDLFSCPQWLFGVRSVPDELGLLLPLTLFIVSTCFLLFLYTHVMIIKTFLFKQYVSGSCVVENEELSS